MRGRTGREAVHVHMYALHVSYRTDPAGFERSETTTLSAKMPAGVRTSTKKLAKAAPKSSRGRQSLKLPPGFKDLGPIASGAFSKVSFVVEEVFPPPPPPVSPPPAPRAPLGAPMQGYIQVSPGDQWQEEISWTLDCTTASGAVEQVDARTSYAAPSARSTEYGLDD